MTNTLSPRSTPAEGLREDLVALRENEHWKDGRLFARQDTVEGKGHGLLRIKPGPQPLSATLASSTPTNALAALICPTVFQASAGPLSAIL